MSHYSTLAFKLRNFLNVARFFLKFRKRGWLERGATINSFGHFKVGNNCAISKGVKINIAHDGILQLLDNTIIGANSQIEVKGYVQIGPNVTISDNVFIADITHAFPTVSTSGIRETITKKHVVIDEGCWIGRNVFVNPGCSISGYNIIAANSVVSRNITGSWGLYGGQPAKFIRNL